MTLITRYGAGRVRELLPGHIEAVENSEHGGGVVVWQCDPMHGNTRTTAAGIKTRRFADILAELRETLRVHAARGTYLGGVSWWWVEAPSARPWWPRRPTTSPSSRT